MKIGVANDHRGFKFKGRILAQLAELKHEIRDFGSATAEVCDYPDYAAAAARAVSQGEVDRAILIGRTGLGMCIVANKFREVRAAVCSDELSAESSRRHMDANILCIAEDLMSDQMTLRIIDVWLATPFDGGRHAVRVAKISGYEQRIREIHI